MRITKLFIALVLSASVVLVAGCSATTSNSGSVTVGDVNDSTGHNVDASGPTHVGVGETFTIPDMFEVTLDSAEWLDEVVLHGDGWTSTVGQRTEGASYFVIRATVKNIGTAAQSVGSGKTAHLTASYKINDTYDIEPDIVVDTETGHNYEIGPLMGGNVFIYGLVSNEIKDQFEKCDVTLMGNMPDENGVWHLDAKPIGEYISTFSN
ncbi:hypothetical protein [Collinsella sp. An307]|uniref:hypothetical protein n=1 Tax=Collinsella sp. An307 TaxID=1965630 RepID=UPI0011804918|nr:hypothetical protein [Collinsella sp. An307]